MKKTITHEVEVIESKELAIIEKDIKPIIDRSGVITIKDDKTMAEASELRTTLKAFEKRVVADRESMTKPLKLVVKNITARFEPIETAIDTALSAVTYGMSNYQTMKQKESDDEAARIAARVAPGKGNLSVETAAKKIANIDTPAAVVSTASGSTKFRTDKKFEVLDVSKLPKEYIMPDEVAIRRAMISGTELPGVRYFSVQIPINSR